MIANEPARQFGVVEVKRLSLRVIAFLRQRFALRSLVGVLDVHAEGE